MGMVRRDLSNNRDWKTTPGEDKENDAKFCVPGSEGSGNVSEGVKADGGPDVSDANMQSSGFDSREIEAKGHVQGSKNVGKPGSATTGGVTNFGKGGKKV